MNRIVGLAEKVALEANYYDLVLTSPPAYPSPSQPPGFLGTEESLRQYLLNLASILRRVRKALKHSGVLCLIIEPQVQREGDPPIMEALASTLASTGFHSLGLYAWNHPPTLGSWVAFLAPPGRAKLFPHPALEAKEWLIPYDEAKTPGYGFFEFPEVLVETILACTIPGGGNVLDPFAGPARALRKMEQAGRCRLTLVEPDYPVPLANRPEEASPPGPS